MILKVLRKVDFAMVVMNPGNYSGFISIYLILIWQGCGRNNFSPPGPNMELKISRLGWNMRKASRATFLYVYLGSIIQYGLSTIMFPRCAVLGELFRRRLVTKSKIRYLYKVLFFRLGKLFRLLGYLCKIIDNRKVL